MTYDHGLPRIANQGRSARLAVSISKDGNAVGPSSILSQT